jgi:hypothetical protein
MLNLILKDIRIQKKTVLLSAAYSLFSVAAFSRIFTSNGAYIFSIMNIVYLFVTNSSSYDEKNKCEIVLNSLPIARRDFVTAKYLALLVFYLIGITFTGFSDLVLRIIGLNNALPLPNYETVLFIILTIGIMYSIYYPLYFKFGLIKLRMFYMILYMLFFFGPLMLISYTAENPNNNIISALLKTIQNNKQIVTGVSVLAAVLIVILSYTISITIYRRKEF